MTGYDLKKLFAASFEARFLVIGRLSRSISGFNQRDALGQFLDRQAATGPVRSRG